jgi:hypothetical protein
METRTMVTLFRDEKANDAPEYMAKISRLERDFPKQVKSLEKDLRALASLAGIVNTKLLVNSLLDSIESRGDIPQ